MPGSMITPKLESVLKQRQEKSFVHLNCHRIGEVQSFDKTNQTAVVRIVDKRVNIDSITGNLTYSDYAPLTDVPVFTPISQQKNGKKKGIEFPINTGDSCLLLFNDRDMENWFTTGQIQPPLTSRSHQMTDAIAIVGLHNESNKVSNYDNEAVSLYYEDSEIKSGKTSSSMKHKTTQIIAEETKASITVGSSVFNIDSLFKIENSALSLKTLISDLADLLKTLQFLDPVTGPAPLSPTSISAIDVWKAKISQLLS